MNNITPLEYVKIAIASQYGLDKETFETRLAWVEGNIANLLSDSLINQADKKYAYITAVHCLDDALAGRPTGYIMGLDATCSGISIMAVLTGCLKSATITNLVNPDVRYDAYSEGMKEINLRLHDDDKVGLGGDVSRDDFKDAIMTHFYGSFAQPRKRLGDGSPAHRAFYPAMRKLCPGPSEYMDIISDIRNPDWTEFTVTLPDRHTNKTRIMVEESKTIEVANLGGATFSHIIKSNKADPQNVSIYSMIIHGTDGFIVRELNERANYDKAELESALVSIKKLLTIDAKAENDNKDNPYGFISMACVDWLHDLSVTDLVLLQKLITNTLLEYKPFEILGVHDEIKCSPNNMHMARIHYKNIMIELAESTLLQHFLNELTGSTTGVYTKLIPNLSDYMQDMEYQLS